MDRPALSRNATSIEHYKTMYDRASRLAKFGAWDCDLETEALTWTDGVYDIFDIPRSTALRRSSILDFYEDESRAAMERLRAEAIRTGGSFTLDARIRTGQGANRWMRLTAEVGCEKDRPVRIFGAKQDITRERELWDRLKELAERDPLTGLANRRMFEEQFHAATKPGAGSATALALIDLNDFKAINDRLGHSAGDECLRQVGSRLHRMSSDAVVVARLGGDEFAVLLRAPLGRDDVMHALGRALHSLCLPVFWKDRRIDLGASVGVTMLKAPRRRGLSRLFEEADCALYTAKAEGGNMIRVFEHEPTPQRQAISPEHRMRPAAVPEAAAE